MKNEMACGYSYGNYLTSALSDPSIAKMLFEQATQSMDLTGRQQETIASSCSTNCIMVGQSNNHTPSAH